MSLANCNPPIITGRFIAVGIFLSDECGVPTTGADAGWIDWCPAALSMEDDVTEGEAFVRTCANGQEIVNVPGEDTLAGINVNLDLNGVDPTWIASVSGSAPVTQDGTVVGWDACKTGYGSASIYLWREIVGESACGAGGTPNYLLTVLPWVDKLRITEEGEFGSGDSYMRLTGRARFDHQFGSGPWPAFPDGTDPAQNPPVKFDDPIEASCARRTVVTPLAPPDDCGLVAVA